MRRNSKKHKTIHIVILMVAVLSIAMLGLWIPGNNWDVRAAEPDIIIDGKDNDGNAIDPADELAAVFLDCNQNTANHYVALDANINLTSDLFASGAPFQLTKGTLTLDLKEHNIDASACSSNNPIFLCNGGTLTITDSTGNGSIKGSSNVVCVKAEGGTLNISGGNFTDAAQCLNISSATVNISDGTFVAKGTPSNSVALMMSGANTNVTIDGGNFKGEYATIWVRDDVSSNSKLTIKDGDFTVSNDGPYGYVCYVVGICDIDISGGTYNLQSPSGSTLVLGEQLTDDKISISGGTYNGRIARFVKDESGQNYTAFYGGTDGSSGIFAEGYVLTANAVNTQEPKTVFSQDNVQVKPGSLITFNTRRSSLEEYTTDETLQENTADYYSIVPVSIDGNGTPYSAVDGVTPAVESSRISDGNTYSFNGWYDDKGNAFATVQEFINQNGWTGSTTVNLYAGWKAQTGAEAGLRNALKNSAVVNEIEMIQDIDLPASITEELVDFAIARVLNLGGHALNCSTTGEPALTLNGAWNIKNGTITNSNQPCLQINGTATIENLDCLSGNASYAVGFGSVSTASASTILTGTFEAKDYALCIAGGTADNIANLFGSSYSSSTGAVTAGGNTYLSSSRLIVSQSPITYIGNGVNLDFGSYVYGENVPATTQIISNEEYVGDILITAVTVDNPAFTVAGEGEPKLLKGGISQSVSNYSYVVGVAEDVDVGNYTGTLTVSYTKMDGSAGYYTQNLSVTIAKAYTLSGTVGKNGWYTSAVTIYPAEGYTISTDANGIFGEGFQITETAEPVIYLKNGSGAVTRPIQVEKIWIDDKAPVITGVENGANYHDGDRVVLISDEHLKSVTLDGVDILFDGTMATVLVKSSIGSHVLVAEDEAGNTVTCTFYVERLIDSAGVYYLTAGEVYKLGSGSWKVTGDDTVYVENVIFYVASDGEYEFLK
ncbi:MAG: hypothetical protein ACI4DK_00110 [Lachnospiraceae bacterium]